MFDKLQITYLFFYLSTLKLWKQDKVGVKASQSLKKLKQTSESLTKLSLLIVYFS